MPTFLSTVKISARPKIDISTQGIHQLALRLMSVKVLPGATKVSMTRSTSDNGRLSGGTAAAELMGSPSSRTVTRGNDAARLYHRGIALGCGRAWQGKPLRQLWRQGANQALSSEAASASSPSHVQ